MSKKSDLNRISIRLAYYLRHHPEEIGLVIDKEGWVSVAELCRRMPIDPLILGQIVGEDKKTRYAFSEDLKMIRANQGHSTTEVAIEYVKAIPPQGDYDFMFHGTTKAALPLIKAEGLKKMSRHHVHLTMDSSVASASAKRWKGKEVEAVVLIVDTAAMIEDGFTFFRSPNDVWLVDHVPSQYLITNKGRLDDYVF